MTRFGNYGVKRSYHNLYKRHGRIEILPRICVMFVVLKGVSFSWLWFDVYFDIFKISNKYRR